MVGCKVNRIHRFNHKKYKKRFCHALFFWSFLVYILKYCLINFYGHFNTTNKTIPFYRRSNHILSIFCFYFDQRDYLHIRLTNEKFQFSVTTIIRKTSVAWIQEISYILSLSFWGVFSLIMHLSCLKRMLFLNDSQ